MQKSLSFSKGLTNVPSDLLSDDSELVESDGIIFRNGELHPIQKPLAIGNIDGKIVYVHRGNGFTNIIVLTDDDTLTAYSYKDGQLAWLDNLAIPVEFMSASSVGNTLVVSTSKGIYYARFVGGRYEALGSDLPRPELTVWLNGSGVETDSTYKPPTITDYVKTTECKAYYDANRRLCQIEEISLAPSGSVGKLAVTIPGTSAPVESRTQTYIGYAAIADKETDFNDAVQGIVAHSMALAKKKKRFAFPFFIRCALRLYDGSYARISAPVLCLPSIRNNGVLYPRDFVVSHTSAIHGKANFYFASNLHSSELHFKVSISGREKWSDIVKDFVMFASDEVLPFSLDDGWRFCQPSEMMGITAWDAVTNSKFDDYRWTFSIVGAGLGGTAITDGPLASAIVAKKLKTDELITKELEKCAVFYKLFEVAVDSKYTDGSEHNATDIISDSVVETLAEQEQLGVDDYYGWATKSAQGMFAYNGRLNLTGVSRFPFAGFRQFVATQPNPDEPGPDDDPATQTFSYDYYVNISSSTMNAWVKSEIKDALPTTLISWLYYPDPNAKKLIFFQKGTDQGFDVDLQQHPRLNGAYPILSLPTGNEPAFTAMQRPTVDNGAHEDLSSQVFTSVVNNPFVFEASGDNTVGTGRIIGVAANTEPVSQGQFGQYPLIVFTDEGIYGMSVSNEGLYSASHPLAREVCNNPDSITPTGNLVFFTSERGLMAVSGGTVTCVSGQLGGRVPRKFGTVEDSFSAFLRNSLIAYDYRDSLLHIFSKGQSYEYIYSLSDHTFAMNVTAHPALAVANVYPDYLVQDTSGELNSYLQRPNINVDTRKFSGTFTTRPLKLGLSLQLKTLRQIVHFVDTDGGKLSLRIYGSNDCRHWEELHSLHGKPWKYFTFSYTFNGFSAADSFSGAVVDFTPRLTDKLR